MPTTTVTTEQSDHRGRPLIKDIYSTDAKASGLLVMASYNWGEHRVIDRSGNCLHTRETGTSGS